MFVERMSRCETEALYQVADSAGQLLDSIGFPWWLSHGSLLGAWRHHGIIPWDDDLDMAFPRAHTDTLQRAAQDSGWKYTRLAPFLAKIWHPNLTLYSTGQAWGWPYIDVTLYDEAYQRIIIEYGYHSKFVAFDCNLITPTHLCTFGPLQLPVPRSPVPILNTIYPNWSRKPTSAAYCHRQECFYSEPSETKGIQKLSLEFPMHNIEIPDPDGVSLTLRGLHPYWNGLLYFCADCRVNRPNGDEGYYRFKHEEFLLLEWDAYPPELLIWDKFVQKYVDSSKPFTLEVLQSLH